MTSSAQRSAASRPMDGRARVVIEHVTPRVDGGRFAAKRVVGDAVAVEADCFADGHDVVAVRAAVAPRATRAWHATPMAPLGNDRWRAAFARRSRSGATATRCSAWVDRFLSWRHDFARRVDADDMRARRARRRRADRAGGRARARRRRASALQAWARSCSTRSPRGADVAALKALGARRRRAARSRSAIPTGALRSRIRVELPLIVDRERARFSTLVRALPALGVARPGAHGTFADCEARLPYVARAGLRRAVPAADPSDRARAAARAATTRSTPSPTTSAARGRSAPPKAATRRSIRELGTLEDFRRLVRRGRASTASRSRSTSPSSARPTIRTCKAASGVVPQARPTAASSTPRTRRRSTRTSIRSTSRPRTGRAVAGAARA